MMLFVKPIMRVLGVPFGLLGTRSIGITSVAEHSIRVFRHSDRESQRASRRNNPVMSTHEAAWENPQAMAIPEGGYFERVEGNYGPDLSSYAGLTTASHHRKTQAGTRGRDAARMPIRSKKP